MTTKTSAFAAPICPELACDSPLQDQETGTQRLGGTKLHALESDPQKLNTEVHTCNPIETGGSERGSNPPSTLLVPR